MILCSIMIRNLRTFIDFTLPYVKPYRGRLYMGIALAMAYGLSNGTFVALTQILIERLDPSSVPLAQNTASAGVSGTSNLAAQFHLWLNHSAELILPRSGQPITPLQIAGGLLLLPLLAAIRGILSYSSSYCISWVGEHITSDLRCSVLDKLISLSLDFFDQAKMGDLLGRVQSDTTTIHNSLERGVSDGFKEPFTLLGVVMGLLWLDWKLTILGLIFLPACIIPITIFGKRIKRAAQAGLHRFNEGSSLLVESLSGIRVVKAFGLEKTVGSRFRETSRHMLHHNMKKWQSRGLTNPIMETISAVGIGMIIVYVTSREIPVSSLGAFLAGLIFLMTPVKKLAAIHLVFKEGSVAMERMRTLLETESSVEEISRPVPLGGPLKEIHFEKVHFSYGANPVLQGVNVRIPAGYRLGIAGESGSGKSSLLNLLFRFYDPTGGRLLFNEKNVRELSLAELRHHLALVSQDTILFDGSVADNIACGKPGPASREEIEAAARSAYAHDFISALPQGYDTLIGERGTRLSGGQRQRMAIARAFIRNAEVLVLDEATAALDAKAEEEVQMAIEQLTQNRTVICVAHRLATLRTMDRIIILDQGKIVEEGSFAELLGKNGAFASMAQKQGVRA